VLSCIHLLRKRSGTLDLSVTNCHPDAGQAARSLRLPCPYGLATSPAFLQPVFDPDVDVTARDALTPVPT